MYLPFMASASDVQDFDVQMKYNLTAQFSAFRAVCQTCSALKSVPSCHHEIPTPEDAAVPVTNMRHDVYTVYMTSKMLTSLLMNMNLYALVPRPWH